MTQHGYAIDGEHPFAYLDDFLGLARSGADWLERNAKHDDDGIYWEYEPEQGTAGGHSFFSGDCGVALAFLQLWRETGEEHYRDIAIEQARSHASRWEHGGLTPELPHEGTAGLERIPGNEWSYYLGVTGPAYVLLEVGRATRQQELVDAGLAILDETVRRGRHDDGVYWSGQPGVLLDGGIVIVLAWAAQTFGRQEYAQAVEEAASYILAKADKRETGLSWTGLVLPGVDFGEHPGFEFGTAGVGYLLLRAYQVTGREDFLKAAVEGERYLRSIEVPVGDGALLPYVVGRNDVFYLGNCHGPAGSSRFAQQLFNVTGDERYLEWRSQLYRGLLATGAPQTHSAGYWRTSTLCCGTAAIAHFGTALWSVTDDEQYRRFALDAARQLAGEAFLENGDATWPDSFVRVDPSYASARTPYLSGVAGIVATLVESERLKRGLKPVFWLPEDAYAYAR